MSGGLVALNSGDSRVNPVLYPAGQRVWPLADRLGCDADRFGGRFDGPSQEGERGLLVHATFKHAFSADASILFRVARKVPHMEFGDRLAHALALADESRDGLAKAIGITVQAISQVITGSTRALTAENTVKAARHLRVSAYWLATGKEQPRGSHALREMISDEALSYAVEFDAMTETEKGQFKMLLAVAIEGRRHLGGMSNFGDEIAEG